MKKPNALISLASTFFLIGHIVLTLVYLCTGFRLELLSNIFARSAYSLILFHILVSFLSLFIFHEKGKVGVSYPWERIRVIVQRVSGILILVFLHGHIFQMVKVINHNAMTNIDKTRFIVINLIFFSVLFLHIAVSLSRSFLTFGWIVDVKTFEKFDKNIRIISGIVWLCVCVVVVVYILNYNLV